MDKVIRLDNPKYMRIDTSDYLKNEKDILKEKEEIIKKIPKENIVGLGYTCESIDGGNHVTVREYVVIKIKGLLVNGYALDKYPSTHKESSSGNFEYVQAREHSACSENNILLFLPLVCIEFMKQAFFKNYTSNLKELGYVALKYIDEKKEDEIIELFENNKFKSLEQETSKEVYTVKVKKVQK